MNSKNLLLTTTALLLVSSMAVAQDSDQELREIIKQQQHQLERLQERLDVIERGEQDLEIPPDVTLRPPKTGQVSELEERVDALEAARAETVSAGSKEGSFKIPGTNTSLKLGGYVKADLIYDVGPENGDTFAASAIPADGSAGDDRKGAFRAHARQTRINLTSWTPTEVGEAKLFVEGDFFGSGGNEVFSNSTSFRLRHAYGEVGPVLAGQTWTLFMPLDSYPETVDFFGPAGIPFIRQGTLRYTHAANDRWTLAASVENSELSGTDASGDSVGSDSGDLRFGIDTLPDFVGAVTYESEDWSARFAGVARLLETDDAGSDDRAFGWGLSASAVVPTIGKDTAQLNAAFGDGIGRYIINGGGQDAFVDADGDLETIKSWGIAAGYTHHWNEKWRSNLVYGRYQLEDTFFEDQTESLDTAHLNLIWSPSKRLEFGAEYIFGHRAFEDSDLDNEGHRLQFGARFSF